jgi:osmotically inducible lipoprotein OsmB
MSYTHTPPALTRSGLGASDSGFTGKAPMHQRTGGKTWFHSQRTPAMKLRHIVVATACTAALALGGCASNPTSAQVGTGVGAVVGGAAGNAVFGGPVGTIGGAAAGALIGHEIGEDRDQRRGYRR